MEKATEFYRSQIGDTTVINYSYTDKPWRLLVKDMSYFFVYAWALPWILWPIYPYGSGELDELYPSARNLFCIATHFILVVLQLAFVLGLPFALIFPLWMDLLAAGIFFTINWLLCKLLNGDKIIFHSDEKYAKPKPEHEHEQWIFLNGVAVGEHWMKGNLNRLALTFGRPVLGIHNKTSGIIFDVVECLVQRNLSYATGDIRACFKQLKEVLYDPRKSKVVFILHSQGGIEGGLVLDWLLQEMPQDLLAKLEVFTFGNAANHFNNPHRHALSESMIKENPLGAMTTLTTETSLTSSPVETKTPATLSKDSSILSSRSSMAIKDRAIGHVEHYAHTTDFVAIWGVLHFATNRMGSPQLPRFLGRLFSRSTSAGGHQFNQHYLDGMFPLAKDPDTGDYTGADENNEFMNEIVEIGKEDDQMCSTREAFDISYGGVAGFGSGDITTPVEVVDPSKKLKQKGEVMVKDLSRLWQYRNGRSPAALGVLRNATM